ncbi:hypothetical protein [Roseiconus lacunae]|uniref:hypothetical protein n=1 Tax=Roseiconus lacunae TaxID=2605694 RepID=UPI001E3C718E|nr:hypothetical protein [Roseiconus lacunae]MCD0457857.1 hypothetical protein [Roseiconus lacunae]
MSQIHFNGSAPIDSNQNDPLENVTTVENPTGKNALLVEASVDSQSTLGNVKPSSDTDGVEVSKGSTTYEQGFAAAQKALVMSGVSQAIGDAIGRLNSVETLKNEMARQDDQNDNDQVSVNAQTGAVTRDSAPQKVFLPDGDTAISSLLGNAPKLQDLTNNPIDQAGIQISDSPKAI